MKNYTYAFREERKKTRETNKLKLKCSMRGCSGRLNFCIEKDHIPERYRSTEDNQGQKGLWDGFVMECDQCGSHIHVPVNVANLVKR